MRRNLLLLLLLLFVGGAGPLAEEPAGPADPRFEFLKGLAGSWTGPGVDGASEARHEFRVTAGGTAVEEREFAGTPMEMVTLYHMQGRDLVATHYCMLGNQPRVKAADKLVGNSLTFACNGTPGNAASHDDEHVHGWTMRLDADGKLHTRAELVRAGQVTESPAMVLTRTETASR